MEKMLKQFGRIFVGLAFMLVTSFCNITTSEAAIKLVDQDEQPMLQEYSRQQPGLEILASNGKSGMEVLEQGSSNSQLEQLASTSNMEVLDQGSLDNSFEVTKIFVSNRITGQKSAYTLKSYNDYKLLLDKLETGSVIIITSPIQVSNINKWSQEVGEKFTRDNKGVVVSFSDVNSLSQREIDIFSKYVDLSKCKSIEIRKEYKSNIIKYDDGKTDFDRGMETLNNLVSTWNMIDNLRH